MRTPWRCVALLDAGLARPVDFAARLISRARPELAETLIRHSLNFHALLHPPLNILAPLA